MAKIGFNIKTLTKKSQVLAKWSLLYHTNNEVRSIKKKISHELTILKIGSEVSVSFKTDFFKSKPGFKRNIRQ